MAALVTFRWTTLAGQERWNLLIPLCDCPVSARNGSELALGGLSFPRQDRGGEFVHTVREGKEKLCSANAAVFANCRMNNPHTSGAHLEKTPLTSNRNNKHLTSSGSTLGIVILTDADWMKAAATTPASCPHP
jgi:hypothetical protein